MNINGEVTYVNDGFLWKVSKFIDFIKRSDDENGSEKNERD